MNIDLDGTTRAILKQIASLGYAVTIRDNGTRMTAVQSDGDERHEATHDDPYRCACRLAEAVGIDLEG